MQCKRVCKTWRALIADPVFIDLYHQKHPIIVEWVTLCDKNDDSDYHLHFGEYNDNNNDDHGKMINPFEHSQPFIYLLITTRKRNTVCSCNCLIFSMSVVTNNMFVCNAFNREHVDLPLPLSFEGGFRLNFFYHGISLASGFGYNSYTNEYKIVIIYYKKRYSECSAGYITIYTLGSGRWREKGEISPELINGTEPGVFLNGALHWLTEKKEIVLFDLADEEFRIVPSPPPPPSPSSSQSYVPRLGLSRGCLYVTRKLIRSAQSSTPDMKGGWWYMTRKQIRRQPLWTMSPALDIWVMDNEQSWTRRFSMPLLMIIDLSLFLKVVN